MKIILGRLATFLKLFGEIQLKSAALCRLSTMEIGTVTSLLATITQPETMQVVKCTHSVQQLRLVQMESMQLSQACASNHSTGFIISLTG